MPGDYPAGNALQRLHYFLLIEDDLLGSVAIHSSPFLGRSNDIANRNERSNGFIRRIIAFKFI